MCEERGPRHERHEPEELHERLRDVDGSIQIIVGDAKKNSLKSPHKLAVVVQESKMNERRTGKMKVHTPAAPLAI